LKKPEEANVLVTPRGCGEGGMEDVCLMDTRFPVGEMGMSGTL